MPLGTLVACLALAASGLSAQLPSPDPGQLRWVRGTITAISPTSVTLRLRDIDLTLSTASATQRAVGERVEAHYTERRGQRRAVMFLDAGTSGTISKRPGRSYRGTVERVRRGTLSLRVDGKRHNVTLESSTTLVAADGRALASGRRDVAAALAAGQLLLVIYDEQSDDIMAGDIMIPGTARLARQIRQLE